MDKMKMISVLEKDLEALMRKRTNLINVDEDRKALDVTRIIKDTLDLLDKATKMPIIEDGWKTMTSCYGMMKPEFKQLTDEEINPTEHFIDVISVWEQNQNEEIRNHRIYERGGQIL